MTGTANRFSCGARSRCSTSSLRVRSGLLQGTINLLLLPSKGATEVRFRERPLGLAVFATPALRLALQLRNRVSLVRLDNVVCARQAAS